MANKVKIIIFTPIDHADLIRNRLIELEGESLSKYKGWSISSAIIERFIPSVSANPSKGQKNILNEIKSEKIELHCHEKDWQRIVDEIIKIHPYEKPAIEVIPLIYP